MQPVSLAGSIKCGEYAWCCWYVLHTSDKHQRVVVVVVVPVAVVVRCGGRGTGTGEGGGAW